ncbi:protein of unknown function [Verrucomicrobium sp. GAS474]|uniref:DUF4886 domain-containing protein n=1 Tax=Verrucomicrobium sp. GAS474 TaxID=1882831 RepID=UPI00087B05E7|nr:DUF4886 domain-containing protein [Verrucomicrobium sp. GAS474]SDT97819.1 protein of unknown function [Verrucomicrobium sp. GAS474]
MSLPRLLGFGLLLFLPLIPLRSEESAPAPLRVLAVGNSFSQNVFAYLPQFAKAGGKSVSLLIAYKGGCSLKEHADAYAAAENDPASPAACIYSGTQWFEEGHPAAAGTKSFNLIDALKKEKWDIVTIQQYSALSYKPETYEPYAGQVVAAIRKYAPQAEIVIHETWAYRDDDPLFRKGDFTPALMQEQLKAAYAKLAAAYHFRTVPVGDAFAAARVLPRWTFAPDAAFDFAHPAEGALPQEKAGLHNGYRGAKDPKTGVYAVHLDGHHANKDGEYLGAAVFYEALFGGNVEEVAFVPPNGSLTPEDAATLRHIAHQAVRAQKAAEAAIVPATAASAPSTQ